MSKRDAACLLRLVFSLLGMTFLQASAQSASLKANSWLAAAAVGPVAPAWSVDRTQWHVFAGGMQKNASHVVQPVGEPLYGANVLVWGGVVPPLSAGIQLQLWPLRSGQVVLMHSPFVQWAWFEQFGLPTLAWRVSLKNFSTPSRTFLQVKSYGLASTWGYRNVSVTANMNFYQFSLDQELVAAQHRVEGAMSADGGSRLFGSSSQLTLDLGILPGEWGVYVSYAYLHERQQQTMQVGSHYQW
ncbi:MAG: hypothetical protein OXT67_07195 [Zetaproteobacteria bacterium]|nr:hypothetical protein [Zetaproteobacteria bacterium]